MPENALFPTLTPEQIRCLSAYGTERTLQKGDILFTEGEAADRFFILLEGQVRVTRQVVGTETLITLHQPGEFTGEIALLNGQPAIATGTAMGTARVLEIMADCLQKILAHSPAIAIVVLSAFAQRRPEALLLAQQREKLTALGVMAAGLAHELNNPASAARRAAAQLREALQTQRQFGLALKQWSFTPEQSQAMADVERDALAHQATTVLNPLEQSEQEDAMSDWLESYHIAEAWKLAPTFVAAGLDAERLRGLTDNLPPDSQCDALGWLEATLNVTSLIDEIEQSTVRMSDLVKAVKSYSFMDQAPIQTIDVREGLENTLTILGHKLRKKCIEVIKEYAADLPHITAYGSELNQVWTNLIDNSIDALDESGKIWIRLHPKSEDCLIVEIADNGPGIPADVQPHIFEPFFTTKGVGQGTGLGLDIAYRIVVGRHHGDIRVDSQPGDTRFKVILPVKME